MDSFILENNMKKLILFTVLPILLLSSCNSSTPGSNPEPSKEVISIAFGQGVITQYHVGDAFISPIVIATYNDETTEDVTEETTFSGYDMNVANTYTVTATYQNKTATYDITVKAKATLEDIYLDNVVSEYEVGDTFIKPTVTAKYSDNTYSIVTNDTSFSGYNMNVANTYSVKATYQGKTKSYTITVSEKEEEFVRKQLDCGYLQMPLPKNHTNPFNLKTTLSADDSSWYDSSLKSSDEFPYDEYRFIYGKSYDDGPSGEKSSPSFYSSTGSNPGGLKMDQKNKGFQTGEFTHTGAKLEIRIGISQLNNAGGSAATGQDVYRIYYFNNKGALLGQDNYGTGNITSETVGKYLKIYKTDSYTPNIAYFEFRLINLAYKGSQNYNFGIDYVNLKSWERI